MTLDELLTIIDHEDWHEIELGTIETMRLLANEVWRLRKQVPGHCDRIAAQSELLAQRALRKYADDLKVEKKEDFPP